MQLGYQNALQDLSVRDLKNDWHSEVADDSSQVRQLPLCRFNHATIVLGRLTPRVQALSIKSQEVFENWGPSHKPRNIGRRLPTWLLNDAVFKPVTAWLSNPSEDMNDGCSIFNSLSTTKNKSRNEAVVVELVSCSSKFTKATLSLQEELGSRTYKAVSDINAAHRLVVSCHALLLDSFGAVLGALQDVADAERHAAQGAITPGFEDLRLAMVVQLCSYLFVRQCRVVDTFLEVNSGPKSSAGSPNEGTEDGRVIQELKAWVHSRVAWFQRLWYDSI